MAKTKKSCKTIYLKSIDGKSDKHVAIWKNVTNSRHSIALKPLTSSKYTEYERHQLQKYAKSILQNT